MAEGFAPEDAIQWGIMDFYKMDLSKRKAKCDEEWLCFISLEWLDVEDDNDIGCEFVEHSEVGLVRVNSKYIKYKE